MEQRQFLSLLVAMIWLITPTATFADPFASQNTPYYGPVQSGETLWKIARKIRPDVSLSYYQVMLALLKANPASFQNSCNLNTLKIGSNLIIPSIEDMRFYTHAQASKKFSQQVENWEMFTKHGMPIQCENTTTNDSLLNNKFHSDAAIDNHRVDEPAQQQAAVKLASEDAISTHNTLTSIPIAPSHTEITNTSPPSNISSHVDTPASSSQSSHIVSASLKQLFSIAFWSALLNGYVPQPATTALLIFIVSLFALGLLMFFLYKISDNTSSRIPLTAQQKEQKSLDKATEEINSELAHNADDLQGKVELPQASVIAERPFGWFLAVAVPLFLYFWMQYQSDLNQNSIIFLAIISIPLIMWMFSLLPDFVPALFAVLLCLLFGLAPPEVALSGFSSNGFLLTFSVLGLGVVITSSGLTYRYTLLMLKWLPEHTVWYQFALFFTGVLFTPIVPSIAGRAAISAPILRNMTQGLDAKTKQRSAGMLYSGGLDGISFVSAIFLTSAPANLIIFGMLPQQEQQAFQFMYWLYAASLTGIIMLILYLVVSAIYFRAYHKVDVSKVEIKEKLKHMGDMSWREWWALAGIIVLAIGIMTASTHKIKIPFVAFTVFFVLLFLGVLTRDEFVRKIDWAFLFLLGCLIGVLATMNYLEIDKLLLLQLSTLGDYMRHDFHVFVFILSMTILIVRLFIPINSTILIFATALLPIASASGVSPWLIGFIILIMAETSFFNYQSPHILYFCSVGKGDLEFNEWSITVFKGLLVIVKLIAIYASIPFWLSIGVL